MKDDVKLVAPSRMAKRDPAEFLASVVALLGAVLLVIGLVGAVIEGSISEGWQRFPLTAGVCLETLALLYFILVSRQARIATNTVIMSLLGTVFIGMVCYLGAYKYYSRHDLTLNKQFTLSDETRKILKNLKQTVHVRVLLVGGEGQAQTFLLSVRDLLDEARTHTDKLDVQFVDPQFAPTELDRIASELKQHKRRLADNIAVYVGKPDDEDHRIRLISRKDLVDFASLRQGQAVTPARAEEALAGAYRYVTSEDEPMIYFLTGHGENDISGRGFDVGHMGALQEGLKKQHMQVKTISLAGGDPVPEDSAVLVVANPRKTVDRKELASLTNYLNRGGRLLMLVDTDCDKSFSGWLARLGVVAGDNVIYDARNIRYPLKLIVNQYNITHPITSPLKNYTTTFSRARSIAVTMDTRKTFKGQPILFTVKHKFCWAESDVQALEDELRPTFNKEEGDLPSPVFFGVALESIHPARTPEGKTGQTAKLVVIGDAEFTENRSYINKRGAQFIEVFANKELFLNAVSWLAGREELISIKPRSAAVVVLQLQGNARQVMAAVMGGIPFIVLLIGIMTYFARRR